ncbi:hypothetical protein CTEN210_05667 [Chaetoceros tenuissimus]|uniref:Exostosin GT47 domain-containing protein n=1 Tax=Chaetoceros tenuissimus TaxID=426638 RepID=A0AAD3CQC0_9STRA|nr:hypothetical protein CTEN210_05667 [Chaetoceros tenuissimus]
MNPQKFTFSGSLFRGRFMWHAQWDLDMINAVKNSHYTIQNASDADIFIVPTPFSGLLGPQKHFGDPMNLAFTTLLQQDSWKKHKGHKHVFFASAHVFFRRDNIRQLKGFSKYYPIIYNSSAVLCYDPHAISEACHNNVDLADFQPLCKQFDPPVNRASISMGMSPELKSMPLRLASLEKFYNSSNLVFFHSRRSRSVSNSTIYRHSPITNITFSNYPKSSIGFDLENATIWQREYMDSKFCLVIRGDDPASRSLWRALRVGCIPVIISNLLPIYSPMLKNTLNMTDFSVVLDEKQVVISPEKIFEVVQNMGMKEISEKIQQLSFAQQVLFPDHPKSLFVEAFLKEAMVSFH